MRAEAQVVVNFVDGAVNFAYVCVNFADRTDRMLILSIGLSILLTYVSILPIRPDRVSTLLIGVSISLTYRVNFAHRTRSPFNFAVFAFNVFYCIRSSYKGVHGNSHLPSRPPTSPPP